MPFAVFRRHQKKMLAVVTLLAMFAFVISGVVNPYANRGGARDGNKVVVDLYDKPIYRSDLNELATERSVANRFLAGLGFTNPFGGYSTRELVDALILKHEADRLGIPDSPDFGRAWLTQVFSRATGVPMSKQLFDMAMNGVGTDISGNQVLQAIASQARLVAAQSLGGGRLVTPLDIFQAYRDQNERSSFRLVAIPAANYLDKVGEPPAADVQALYDKYKDVLPDPARDTPGFKVPRKVKLEILTADGPARAKAIQAKLTEADLKAYYDAHKADFAVVGTLPVDLFKGDPKAELTPQIYTPFSAVKDSLAVSLARDRAQEQITEIFDKISKAVDDEADDYQRAVDENAEAKKEGSERTVPVPTPKPLDAVAKQYDLIREVTPMLSNEAAKHYGQIAAASLGSNPAARNEGKFADTVFAPKSPLYESLEFVDADGRRFLARKLEDVPAHVAPLDEVRPEVVAAWRLDKARALAEAAAKELAESVKKNGGKFKDEVVAGRPVKALEGVSKLRTGMPMMGPGGGLQFGRPMPAELPQIPDAGPALRDALFTLKPGDAAVAPDAPKANYYVIALDHRDPATFAGLYGSLGMAFPYLNEALRDASEAERTERIESLRAQAGLKSDWVPQDERDRQSEESRSEG